MGLPLSGRGPAFTVCIGQLHGFYICRFDRPERRRGELRLSRASAFQAVPRPPAASLSTIRHSSAPAEPSLIPRRAILPPFLALPGRKRLQDTQELAYAFM